jgi:hypothetical protein
MNALAISLDGLVISGRALAVFWASSSPDIYTPRP